MYLQYSRLNNSKFFFFVNRTVEIWNALPPHVAQDCSIASFDLQISEFDLSVHCRGRANTAN